MTNRFGAILSDGGIRNALTRGLVVSPLDPDGDQIQPDSIQLHYSSWFYVPKMPPKGAPLPVIGLKTDMSEYVSPMQARTNAPFILRPKRVAYADTAEYVEIPDWLSAVLDGKSGWGRRWLAQHVTAGHVDPGFRGTLTLELVNNSPFSISIFPGDPAVQIKFFVLDAPALRPYGHPTLNNHYQGQRGPTPARPLMK